MRVGRDSGLDPFLAREQQGQILNCHIFGRLYGKGKRPPEKQKKATETVMQQAELLGEDWAE